MSGIPNAWKGCLLATGSQNQNPWQHHRKPWANRATSSVFHPEKRLLFQHSHFLESTACFKVTGQMQEFDKTVKINTEKSVTWFLEKNAGYKHPYPSDMEALVFALLQPHLCHVSCPRLMFLTNGRKVISSQHREPHWCLVRSLPSP